MCVALAGCGGGNVFGIGKKSGGKRATPETELPFNAKVTKGAEDILNFSVAVANKGEGLDAVRESVRYEGTKYCLYTNGSTDVHWESGGEGDDWTSQQSGDSLVFNGRCVGR
jgi:hypothetical protein